MTPLLICRVVCPNWPISVTSPASLHGFSLSERWQPFVTGQPSCPSPCRLLSLLIAQSSRPPTPFVRRSCTQVVWCRCVIGYLFPLPQHFDLARFCGLFGIQKSSKSLEMCRGPMGCQPPPPPPPFNTSPKLSGLTRQKQRTHKCNRKLHRKLRQSLTLYKAGWRERVKIRTLIFARNGQEAQEAQVWMTLSFLVYLQSPHIVKIFIRPICWVLS